MGTYKKVVPKDTVIKFRTQVGISQGENFLKALDLSRFKVYN